MSNFTIEPWEEEALINAQRRAGLMVVHPVQPKVKSVPSQQLPDLLAQEQFFQSNDIEESTKVCTEHFSYSRSEISISQISMDDDLSIIIDGQRYHLTEKGHGDLCKILQIPTDFALDVPTDLNATIVHRLKSLHQQSVIVVSRKDTREDSIVSIIDPVKWSDGKDKPAIERKKKKPHYQPLSNLSFLHMLEKVWNGAEVDTRITITDSGMQIELLYLDDSFTIEPKVGDITRIGIAVSNSETGGPFPVATGYAFRLRCTNGNKIRHDYGHARFNSDWRCTWENRCDRFTDDLKSLKQCMQDKFGDLQSAYQRMVDERLNDKHFYDWYRQTEYLFRGVADRSQLIDQIFGLEQDHRKEIINRERLRRRELRDANTTVIEPPQSTDLQTWNVFNGITAAARDEVRYHRRTALEGLGSDVLQAYMPPASRN